LSTQSVTSASGRARPRGVYPVGALFALSLRLLLRTKRVLLSAAILLTPVAFSLFWSLTGKPGFGDPLSLWGIILVLAYLGFIAPLSTLMFGATLIAAEQEERTLVYLLTRPVPRWLILLVKYAAALALSVLGLLLSMLASYGVLALHFDAGSLIENFPYWVRLGGVVAAGLFVYLAVFLFLGVTFRRPVVAGLVFVVLWEGLVSLIPGVIRFVTVSHYLKSLAIEATRGVMTVPRLFVERRTSVGVAAAFLAATWLAFFALSIWRFSRAEFQPTSDR
jgi:ABC-type transport system involved in multi-copper enzyme maturation permease subunit